MPWFLLICSIKNQKLKQNESFEQHSQDSQNGPSKFFTSVSFLAGSWLSTASFREMSLSSKPGNGDREWKDGLDITLLYNHAAVSSMKLLLLLPWKVSLHWDRTGIFFYFFNFFFCILIWLFCKKHHVKLHIFSQKVCLSLIQMKRLKNKH